MNPDREPEERMYEEVTSIDSFHQIIEQYLEDYNNVHKTHMNLVIFRCCIHSYIHSIALGSGLKAWLHVQ